MCTVGGMGPTMRGKGVGVGVLPPLLPQSHTILTLCTTQKPDAPSAGRSDAGALAAL